MRIITDVSEALSCEVLCERDPFVFLKDRPLGIIEYFYTSSRLDIRCDGLPAQYLFPQSSKLVNI